MLTSSFSNKPYWLQFCYLLFFIAGGLTIFSSFAIFVGKFCLALNTNFRWNIYVIQSISSFGLFFVPAIFFSYCATKELFSYSRAKQTVPFLLIGYVVVLSILLLPLIVFLGYYNEQIVLPEFMKNIEVWMRTMEDSNKIIAQKLTANSNAPVLMLNIFFMALLPAMFEEFLFRGTLQPFFTKWFANKHLAITFTAFIFSTIHFQFYGFIPRILLGIYLGYLLVWGKSLWLPIVAHFLHNAVSLILDFFAQQQGIDLEAIEPKEIEYFYPAVLFCSICVTLGIYWIWKKSKV